MRVSLLLLCFGLSACSAWESQPNWTGSYEEYLTYYGKAYDDPVELATRAAHFATNLGHIKAQNALHAAGASSWTAGVNEFTDWSTQEFKDRRTGTLPPNGMSHPLSNSSNAPIDESFTQTELPDAVDWREKKMVTEVKNQGGCGSCWAFSATETLESHIAIATGQLFTLSPQQIVSCAPNPNDCGGTGGCDGSTQQLAYKYTEGPGVTLEKDYPYTGETGSCQSRNIKAVAINSGFVTVQPNNYTALAAALAFKGPVAITVAAGGMGWQIYHGGVYDGGLFGCGFTLDHGVQAVGYGTEKGKGYWWVRNSWGPGWGEGGYMKLGRFGEGKEPCGLDKAPADGIACKGNTTQVKYCGECGILSSSSYPTGLKLV